MRKIAFIFLINFFLLFTASVEASARVGKVCITAAGWLAYVAEVRNVDYGRTNLSGLGTLLTVAEGTKWIEAREGDRIDYFVWFPATPHPFYGMTSNSQLIKRFLVGNESGQIALGKGVAVGGTLFSPLTWITGNC